MHNARNATSESVAAAVQVTESSLEDALGGVLRAVQDTLSMFQLLGHIRSDLLTRMRQAGGLQQVARDAVAAPKSNIDILELPSQDISTLGCRQLIEGFVELHSAGATAVKSCYNAIRRVQDVSVDSTVLLAGLEGFDHSQQSIFDGVDTFNSAVRSVSRELNLLSRAAVVGSLAVAAIDRLAEESEASGNSKLAKLIVTLRELQEAL